MFEGSVKLCGGQSCATPAACQDPPRSSEENEMASVGDTDQYTDGPNARQPIVSRPKRIVEEVRSMLLKV